MTYANKQLVRAFFLALSSGDFPQQLLSADMTAWTLTSGDTTKDKFLNGVKLLAAIFGGSLVYDLEAITAEDDRVVVETTSHGFFADDGEAFNNVHVFVFGITDGRISRVAEYMNPSKVADQIVPHMHAAMAAAPAKI